MGFEPYVNIISRYSRTFQVMTPNAFIAPFYFMKAAVTGVAGQVLKYDTLEDTVTVAGSGVTRDQVAGFLMQDVKDLDAGPVKGYRNLQQTVENLGGNIGVLQGSNNVCLTKAYTGSPALSNKLTVASNGYLRVYGSAALETGDPIAIVEATVSSTTPTIEPQQLTASNSPDWIRVRTYNL